MFIIMVLMRYKAKKLLYIFDLNKQFDQVIK